MRRCAPATRRPASTGSWSPAGPTSYESWRRPRPRVTTAIHQLDQEATMPARTATAKWEKGLRDGHGTMALGSGAFEGQYSFQSRFEEGAGTNPEELLGASHAGCFSMALTAGLEAAGYSPESVETSAKVHL